MHYVKSSDKQAAISIMESVQFSTGSVQPSMEDILQLSNGSYSAGDRLKMCCRPSYRIRRLKNKGALLILVWNFLVASVFYYLYLSPRIFHPYWHMYSIAWGLTLPIAGWLADVYLKRYKVVRWSILIMWIASVLLVASSVLSQFVESYYSIKNNYINAVLLFIMSLALGATYSYNHHEMCVGGCHIRLTVLSRNVRGWMSYHANCTGCIYFIVAIVVL